jgi:tetratricopeptide (TPR) repeat protein
MKDYKNALRLYELALDINDNNGVCFAYNGLGSVYIKLGKYNTALKYINRSKKIAEEHNLLRHKLNINRMLAIIWEEKKEYKKSLEFYKKYKIDYDSINSLEVNNRLTDLETKYNFKKNELLAKEKEIKLNEKIDQTNIKLNDTKRQILYGLILVLFLFVVLGFVVYNARIKRLSSDYQKVVLKQKLLRSQMKPHFIFNSLSVLQGIVLHKEYDKASTYISKFSRLLREILETSKEEIINLESEIRIIENYIFLQYISHNSNCTYKITIDKKIDVENFYIPPMIVQPIVENSFEHGFIEINKSYELSIDFELVNGKLVCTITDNGEGLNDSNNKNYFEKKKSVSSTIIKERLELFSKKYGEKYSFKVIDRTLTGNKGTKVILLLPYKIGYND